MDTLIYIILAHMISRNYHSPGKMASRQAPTEFPYSVEVIAENLSVPWAIDISNDGKLYFTERSGAVRVIENGILNPDPLITFDPPFIAQGESGLLGIALDPDFSENRYLYVMHTYTEDNQTYNRVVRLLEQDNKASIDLVIIDKIPGGVIHNGGRIKIDPDGKLYITTGDAIDSTSAQDPTSLSGKILRIELDGSIPRDNPIPNSPVYSLGFKNPQGLAWNAQNTLYASEHGPTGYDEINRIQPGGNYGWPLVLGDEVSTEIDGVPPLIHSGNTIWAPSGMAFVSQGPWQGKLLVANLRGQQLLVMTLNEEGTTVETIETGLLSEYGRLRDVIQARDGAIYLTTSNRDGRGNPTAGDDKIIKLTLI